MSLTFKNDYTLLHWKDRIWKVGQDGKLIPKRDENNQIISNPITGQPEYETIEDGTRVAAKRLNHMDNGIYKAHEIILDLASMVRRMQIQMELDGRVPGNAGTFADTLDGSTNKITLDTTMTDITTPVTAGTSILPVSNVVGFVPFSQVTIFDDVQKEDVVITTIDSNAKTITVQALANNYKKGAKITRSNVAIDTINTELGIGNWQTYTVSVSEVV
ncbi:MAG: integrase [Sporosarcina sp.]